MNALVAPESKSFSHSYLEILRLSPDIIRRTTLRALQRRTPAARIEAMASRFSFGERGSGSGRSSASREAVGTAPGLNSAFHIVTSGCSGPDGPVWMPWDSPGGVGRVRRHPRPPQLPLPVRRLVSDAVAGYRPSPFSGYLPEASANCRTRGSKLRVLQVDHLMSSHNSKFSGRWFELSGVHDRAPGVFPQPSKTAVWTQFLDIKWINPTGRLSDSVR